MGPELKGISLGIWSEKESYSQSEIKNVWVIVKVEAKSRMTMEEDRAFYAKSHFKVLQGKKVVKEFPMSGAMDGMVGVGFAGGISADLDDLKVGYYVMMLEIDSRISNAVGITITK